MHESYTWCHILVQGWVGFAPLNVMLRDQNQRIGVNFLKTVSENQADDSDSRRAVRAMHGDDDAK